MPKKVDPEIKELKQVAAAYKKTPEYKAKMKAIGDGIAFQKAVNDKLVKMQTKS